MARLLIPTGFSPSSSSGASLSLRNAGGHSFSIHPVSPTIVRVVHELPRDRYPQKNNDGVQWEDPAEAVWVSMAMDSVELQTAKLLVQIDTSGCPRLSWFAKEEGGEVAPTAFMSDSPTRAYSFDAATGSVLHYVERENYLPVSEDEFTTPGFAPFLHPDRNELVFGLGESRGGLEKSGKKFTMEGRDALSYSWTDGDPLYKVSPFYLVYNKRSKRWHGVFYNNLNDSVFDMGAECDIQWGCFRSYRASCGPLDYYVLAGDGSLPSILTEYASLVSPMTSPTSFTASSTLPPLSQFGYLSSSLSLAADPKAQDAIIDFLTTSRREGFPVDGLYLSSGWCQDHLTGDRNYFAWNRLRYPDPQELGRIVEKNLEVQSIINVKPWLLDVHPMVQSAEACRAFVRAAPDAKGDLDRSSEDGSAKSWVWSGGFATHKLGRYFDYSSAAGVSWWQKAIKEQLLANGLTGIWIDNNEMAGLVDGDATFAGELGMWKAQGGADNVEKRLGWGQGRIKVGSVGKMAQTIGMARATFDGLMRMRPTERPVIVSRSGVPGIQAFAHASWSGDNSTTWQALHWGTKMTLSLGLSFGPGLYGHDIGGFAGPLHPSPELLVRWCQNGAWHSRFTVHSWKVVSTTLWMYNDVHGITSILRDVLAFRYRLAPTFYSLYVAHYHRRGWPLMKPLFWFHAANSATLHLDEEFIFGSHVLVAPVTIKGARTRTVYLPSVTDTEDNLKWCELDTGVWHIGAGEFVTFDVPLSRTLALVRAGGIFVLGGACKTNIFDGVGERVVQIFPSPPSTSPTRSGTEGFFTLIEDDGKTNDHTSCGHYTELLLSFRVIPSAFAGQEAVEVDYEIVRGAYVLPYKVLHFELPLGDTRQIVVAQGKERVQHTDTFGRRRVGVVVVL